MLEVIFIVIGALYLLNVLLSHFESEWEKNVPYTVLVKEIILYTGFALREHNIKHFPDFKICYYKNKKYAGVYDGKIIVYLGSNPTINDIVNTTLHEVQHHIQHKTDPQYKYYSDYTKTCGYWLNPFEKEARSFASKYEDSCIEYLVSKKIIQKN